MKFSTLLFPAFIASAFASPIQQQQRDTSSLSTILSTLQTSVLAHDASLNKTSASLTPSSSEDDKAAAVASANSAIQGLTASIQTATSSIKNLSAAEQKQGDSKDMERMVGSIYQDILSTMSSMPKDALASTSPTDLAAMASGLGGLGFLLSSLLTGVLNLVTNVLQLLVGVLTVTVPDLPGIIGLPGLTGQ